MEILEANTLYITMTYLGRDARQNFYHWTFYATSDTPPRGTKFHATDGGNQRNPLRYEQKEVRNPIELEDILVCLKLGPANSCRELHQSLKEVPVGSSRALPYGESRWTCRVFVIEALKQLDQDHLASLPPGMDAREIEDACYAQANYFHELKEQTGGESPVIVNDLRWFKGRNLPQADELSYVNEPSSYARPSSHYQPSYMDYTYATDPMETERPQYYGSKPMDVDYESYYSRGGTSYSRSGPRY